MAGAVVVAERLDGLGEDLDLPTRSRERIFLGILTEVTEEHEVVFGSHPVVPFCPEVLERRCVAAVCIDERPPLTVEMLDPLL